MSRVVAKFVPQLLTQLQKNYRVEVTQDNLETIRNNPEFLKKVITLLLTMSTLHEAKQWTRSTTYKFWKDYAMQWEGNGLICGKALTGCFTTITHLPIHLTLSRNFTKHDISQVRQLSYSSMWLLAVSEIKRNPLKRRKFDNVKDIKQDATRQLLGIPRAEFHDCFRKWEQRWGKVVAFKGEYFAGDIIAIDSE